jgi:hypothetical protein
MVWGIFFEKEVSLLLWPLRRSPLDTPYPLSARRGACEEHWLDLGETK